MKIIFLLPFLAFVENLEEVKFFPEFEDLAIHATKQTRSARENCCESLTGKPVNFGYTFFTRIHFYNKFFTKISCQFLLFRPFFCSKSNVKKLKTWSSKNKKYWCKKIKMKNFVTNCKEKGLFFEKILVHIFS